MDTLRQTVTFVQGRQPSACIYVGGAWRPWAPADSVFRWEAGLSRDRWNKESNGQKFCFCLGHLCVFVVLLESNKYHENVHYG